MMQMEEKRMDNEKRNEFIYIQSHGIDSRYIIKEDGITQTLPSCLYKDPFNNGGGVLQRVKKNCTNGTHKI